ncbi:MAG TPA: hypothetical protein PLN24_00030 [Victivallales bacterium]|nr:hypothetical protein [Victivallales bacterium]
MDLQENEPAFGIVPVAWQYKPWMLVELVSGSFNLNLAMSDNFAPLINTLLDLSLLSHVHSG